MSDSPPPQMMIGRDTYVSIGIIALIVGGIVAILSSIASMKSEIKDARTEMSREFEKMSMRVSNLESTKNAWTATDMFKWAVHLQQANPTVKVPEPEVNTK